MNTLREAVQDYLVLRRDLGFKLREAGKGLLCFVSFMEQQCATYITNALALAWAQQAPAGQPQTGISFATRWPPGCCAAAPR